MDNDTTAPPSTARTAATALVKLLVRMEGAPACAPLLTSLTIWTVSNSGVISGHFHDTSPKHDVGSEVLQAAQALFGGEITPTGDRYDAGHAWHILSTTVAGAPVKLRAPVAAGSVEAELRERIAELEAAVAAGQGATR